MSSDYLVHRRKSDDYLLPSGEWGPISRARSFDDEESAEAEVFRLGVEDIAGPVRAPVPALQDFEFANVLRQVEAAEDWETAALYYVAVLGYTPYQVWIKLSDEQKLRVSRTTQKSAHARILAKTRENAVAVGRTPTRPQAADVVVASLEED